MKPRLAITIGDPAGVGPELALKVLSDRTITDRCVPILLGDWKPLQAVAARLSLQLPQQVVPRKEGLSAIGALDQPAIFDFASPLENLCPGVADRATGAASFAYVVDAIDAAMAGHVDAIVTGPIQKEAWHAAGIEFPGHTELLAQRSRAERCCMMLTSNDISCALVTVHVGLHEVPNLLSTERILETILLAHAAVSQQRGRPARVAVCGLNPHAGEGGMFGQREEERWIVPAIEAARAQGLSVSGPLPADTAFVPAMRRQTDVYICMYHDQGLIPLKTLAFDEAVNVTLGLPIVRTSVDHGTALDIAWQGIASDTSMKQAIEMAIRLAAKGTK
ncbi:4-hydroxythreonine-4-phosphate dehydrogenase [Rosistilla carotiformis]|uniref:4-hydroxythreonine-4-phosphate dehydrogenase n=1 Tax=Rosistilla carotiformis TaxID=2528017 RepID=A0A518JZT2_9BACT|nr:4-hydroxythreonine-4-phosphate dehydrogenase PdxA [Rosistilla carotiformis]QDV71054.1 4-hydroxythreonine-4-phosphate dehydrogenase [Rosistilla carotiformis]